MGGNFSKTRSSSQSQKGSTSQTKIGLVQDDKFVERARSIKSIKNIMAPYPSNEKQRLEKLLSYNVLDTMHERCFDEITELASIICQTPISLVSLIDKDRQWFKSKVGLDADQTSREAAFCSYAILDPEKVLTVNNATEDERFATNELVLGHPHIRFYAGAPIVTPDGYALGTLCAIDTKPRQLTEQQIKALKVLSNQVVAQMEAKKHMEDLKAALRDLHNSKEFAELASVSSFENLLLSPAGVAAFMDFLKEEFCAENLEFWERAKEFLETFKERSKDDNFDEAKEIYDTFIKSGSPKQLNITFDAVVKLEKYITEEKVEEEMYEAARGEVFELMKKDSYEKFLVSDHYKKLMSTVRQIGFLRLQASRGK